MPQITLNGQPHAAENQTLAGLVSTLNLKSETVVIEKNGQIVKRAVWENEPLTDGDVIEIVTFVSGG